MSKGRPVNLATLKALQRVREGVPPYRAALDCGISPSTIYRALARKRAKGKKSKPAGRKSGA